MQLQAIPPWVQSLYIILVLLRLSGPITLHKARVSSRFRRIKAGTTELAWSPGSGVWLVNAGSPTTMLSYCFSGPGPAMRTILMVRFRSISGYGPHRTKLCGNSCHPQRLHHAIRMHSGLTWKGSTESIEAGRVMASSKADGVDQGTELREGGLGAEVSKLLSQQLSCCVPLPCTGPPHGLDVNRVL